MDSGNLSQADKYLLYGLLLKKKRSPAQDRKLIAIMRSPRDLDEKIEAILALGDQTEEKDPRRSRTGRRPDTDGTTRKKKTSALVVDVHQELARLLKNSSLKKRFVFTRIGESLDAIHLLRRLQSNAGLAATLSYYQAVAGDWRYLVTYDRIVAGITPEEIMKTARRIFTPENRTLVTLTRGEESP